MLKTALVSLAVSSALLLAVGHVPAVRRVFGI